ncbi:hypothetical protein BBBOND_0309700 [Babesia bigemina]|uniref:Uncharacterized protein n=1 Tax=Babesia bigemina TaxID=5866 RepID=A0A061DAQ3_BABBI|nr:hypothetical protein BBBOND_0309700 [Babesia bigemina]CDR97067.1 hypothetical protein BBBOND_0309700 [Babesia bigemina]|eukprot:XP_012769253.1 hypothetical protein BBBOND_0309700 [Babesia bigemina]
MLASNIDGVGGTLERLLKVNVQVRETNDYVESDSKGFEVPSVGGDAKLALTNTAHYFTRLEYKKLIWRCLSKFNGFKGGFNEMRSHMLPCKYQSVGDGKVA